MVESVSSQQKEHWADNAAKRIIDSKGDLRLYTIASGITPSGVVHIGNFREIITVDLVGKALRKLGKKVRFIYSWDDYDVFRKVPANFPNKEMLAKYLRQPIVDVPDPFGCHSSYAEHNERAIEEELPEMGIFPEFLYQAKKYRACEYAEGMKAALQRKDEIKVILDKWRAEDLEGEWSPVRVFCEKCNTDKTTITSYDGNYTLSYSCDCGFKDSFDFRKKGIAKLQWRVDWPMRWAFEKVDFEPSGKEHSSEGGSNTTANEIAAAIYNHEPPFHIMYEFIAIKGTGGKMSSSRGNTVDLGEMKSVYEPQVIRFLFARQTPSRSFEVSFDGDVITFYEEFDRLERIYFGAELPPKDNTLEQCKAMYEYSAVSIPREIPIQPSFRLVAGVLQLNLFDEQKTFNYFKGKVKNDFDAKKLQKRISCAGNWVKNYAPEQFIFKIGESVSEQALKVPHNHKAAVMMFAESLKKGIDEEGMAILFRNAALANNVPVQELFSSTYLMLSGKEKGPRLFHILENIGIERFSLMARELSERKPVEKKRIVFPGQKELSTHFDFAISPEVREKFPSLRIGVVIAEGLANKESNPEILNLLREDEALFRAKYFGKDFASMKGIKAWREAYSSFGAKPKDHKPAIEALAKRVLKGEEIPSINPFVDLYNCISLKHLLPVGADDLSHVKGSVRLRFALGGEQFNKINSVENEPAIAGEIIYADNAGALCRRWNWRECDRTKITEGTKSAAIYLESLNEDDSLEEAVAELSQGLEKFCSAKVKAFIV